MHFSKIEPLIFCMNVGRRVSFVLLLFFLLFSLLFRVFAPSYPSLITNHSLRQRNQEKKFKTSLIFVLDVIKRIAARRSPWRSRRRWNSSVCDFRLCCVTSTEWIFIVISSSRRVFSALSHVRDSVRAVMLEQTRCSREQNREVVSQYNRTI